MKNFSDISQSEIQRQDENIIDRLSDSTPEEVATVSTVVEEKCGPEAACELEDAIIRNCCGENVTEDKVDLTTDELDVAKSVDPSSTNFSRSSSRRYRIRLRNFSEKIEDARDEVAAQSETPSEEPEDTTPSELDGDGEEAPKTSQSEGSAESTPEPPAPKKIPGVPMEEENMSDEDEHSSEDIDRSIDEQNFSTNSINSSQSAYKNRLFRTIGFKN